MSEKKALLAVAIPGGLLEVLGILEQTYHDVRKRCPEYKLPKLTTDEYYQEILAVGASEISKRILGTELEHRRNEAKGVAMRIQKMVSEDPLRQVCGDCGKAIRTPPKSGKTKCCGVAPVFWFEYEQSSGGQL